MSCKLVGMERGLVLAHQSGEFGVYIEPHRLESARSEAIVQSFHFPFSFYLVEREGLSWGCEWKKKKKKITRHVTRWANI
jgi:hypothetical protein